MEYEKMSNQDLLGVALVAITKAMTAHALTGSDNYRITGPKLSECMNIIAGELNEANQNRFECWLKKQTIKVEKEMTPEEIGKEIWGKMCKNV